jgi:hypothetical protein
MTIPLENMGTAPKVNEGTERAPQPTVDALKNEMDDLKARVEAMKAQKK